MSKFRSKPFEIEATQFTEENDHPEVYTKLGSGTFYVDGHQGPSRVNEGDWIIAEPDGEGFYPCDPETFAHKYEPVK